MRIRIGVLIVRTTVAAGTLAGLVACTGSPSPHPSSGVPGGGSSSLRASTGAVRTPTPYCHQLVAAAPKIDAAQTSLYAGKSTDAAIDRLSDQLTALQTGAPSDLEAALADMAAQFRSARDILQRPTMQARDRIAAFGTRITNDNRVLASYINAHCPPG